MRFFSGIPEPEVGGLVRREALCFDFIGPSAPDSFPLRVNGKFWGRAFCAGLALALSAFAGLSNFASLGGSSCT